MIFWDVSRMQTLHDIITIAAVMTYVPFVLVSGIVIGSLYILALLSIVGSVPRYRH